MTSKFGQKEFVELCKTHKDRLKLVWMALPCGTSTRAREIRVTKPNQDGQVIDPKPLRSDEFPDGVPSLSGKAQEKVLAANSLYEFGVAVACWCDEKGISWAIENPKSSHMW